MDSQRSNYDRRDFLRSTVGTLAVVSFSDLLAADVRASSAKVITDLRDPSLPALLRAEGRTLVRTTSYSRAARSRQIAHDLIGSTDDPFVRNLWQQSFVGIRRGMPAEPLYERLLRLDAERPDPIITSTTDTPQEVAPTAPGQPREIQVRIEWVRQEALMDAKILAGRMAENSVQEPSGPSNNPHRPTAADRHMQAGRIVFV